MSDLWVFGYGSLIWSPGFRHGAAARAHLPGYHRALCIYSVVYRASHERPGLVFGLDHGGYCEGIAFEVPAAFRDETLGYLYDRELTTGAYHARRRMVQLADGSGRTVSALCFIADRAARQYAGGHSLAEQAEIVRSSRGRSGRNLDYVLNTYSHLRDYGISDRNLMRLIALVGHHRLIPHGAATCGRSGGAPMAILERLNGVASDRTSGARRVTPRLPPPPMLRAMVRIKPE